MELDYISFEEVDDSTSPSNQHQQVTVPPVPSMPGSRYRVIYRLHVTPVVVEEEEYGLVSLQG